MSHVRQEVTPGSLWRHYKGGIYEVVCEAIHEGTEKPMIVYRDGRGRNYVRYASSWHADVLSGKKRQPRFARMK